MHPTGTLPSNKQRPLPRLAWEEIVQPGAYVEISTGMLYRVPAGGASPLVEPGSRPVRAEGEPSRGSVFVRVSENPFIFSLGARMLCVAHDIRPAF
jgi:hypothetical protein